MKKIFLSGNDKELKKMKKLVNEINKWDFSSTSDDVLQNQTQRFREILAKGISLDSILPEAYATVREASTRVLDKRHFDVQLMGGISLHKGNIAEMKTGEGKTLVGVLPAYLNSLTGNSVHIVTVNEYLAKRDFEELSPLYSYLGIQSSYITSDMSHVEKKEAYKASVVFGTNNEFGFDYLRDNMAKRVEEKVQSELHYAIIDEVDSILIDESRTPLVISGPSSASSDMFLNTNELVLKFNRNTDYEVDDESQQCYLTEEGVNKAEAFFGITNLYSQENSQLNHFLSQSLKANAIMKKDKDYIVTNGEVHIIDQFTGRIAGGRRYGNGLHQAIEAKEKVKIKEETITKATITYQNFFRMYEKLSGMTGTAETEKEELLQVYGVDTITIPTNQPIKRIDLPDLIFLNKTDKMKAISEQVESLNKTGQPVLIGTSTIEESEEISSHFKNERIQHVVLNAKNHEKEADIISKAGQKNSVTIATNMAGRGTDIKLEEGVQELGGLYILGTSKNENRRVDNQLRGRSGRQGDPGTSQFFVSLEDELMIRFGATKVKGMMERMELDKEGLSSKFLTKVFANAQKRLEGSNYDIRKKLLQYDNVLSKQREVIYEERNKILSEANVFDIIDDLIEGFVSQSVVGELVMANENSNIYLNEKFSKVLNKPLTELDIKQIDLNESRNLQPFYTELFKKEMEKKKTEIPQEIVEDVFRHTLLLALDSLWEQHLESLNDLRQGIHLRAYGQNDPLREYEFAAMDAFEDIHNLFVVNVLSNLYKIRISAK